VRCWAAAAIEGKSVNPAPSGCSGLEWESKIAYIDSSLLDLGETRDAEMDKGIRRIATISGGRVISAAVMSLVVSAVWRELSRF
jgi:hypothetical protein